MNKFSISKWTIECWERLLDTKIIREVASADWSECYEMDAAHVFELENGKYVYVTERGCSCYSSDDADLDICNTEEEAMSKYNQNLKDQ